MKVQSIVGEMTEPISREARSFIEANIRALQQARLDKRNNATLADLFKDRNPYFLRSTRKVAFQLSSYCLDNYLLSVDENLFADFEREFSVFMAQRSQQSLESSEILELFAQDDLPLEFELLSAYSRASNRLLHELYTEFCDEDARVDWERLVEFISSE